MNFIKKYLVLILLFVVLAAFAGFYYFGRLRGKSINYPDNGTGIPANWSAKNVVSKIIAATEGIGTDETLLFATLDGLTNDQLSAVWNEYLQEKNETLFDLFNDELSDDELTRALNYYAYNS